MIDLLIGGVAYKFIKSITLFAVYVIGKIGYAGVFALMFLGSANIPIPSEIIMPFAGSLVLEGTFNFWLLVLVGALGDLAGAVFAYALGYKIGRPIADRWGHYLFISKEHMETGERWLHTYHERVLFISRCIPVVRMFVSLPAGILRVPFYRFVAYTFAGCLVWAFALTTIGYKLGENWQIIEPYFKKADWVILASILAGIIWFARSHYKKRK